MHDREHAFHAIHVLCHSLHSCNIALRTRLRIVSDVWSLTCHDHEPSLGMGRKQERSAVPRACSPPALCHSFDASVSFCASSTDITGLCPCSSAAAYKSVNGACIS